MWRSALGCVVVSLLLVVSLLAAVSCGGSPAVDVSGEGLGASAGVEGSVAGVSRVVAAGDLVARGWDPGGGLVLVSVSVESLSVGWAEDAAAGSSGLRLRWREAPVADDAVWPAQPDAKEGFVDLDASEVGFVVSGLKHGARYGLRLETADGLEAASEVFETLWPPVGALAIDAFAHDAARVSWVLDERWVPVGYALRWRRAGRDAFEGVHYLAPGARDGVVTGLVGGALYDFEMTALTIGGWQSAPAGLRAQAPPVPSGMSGHKTGTTKGIVVDPLGEPLRVPLRLQASAPAYCIGDHGEEHPREGYFERRATNTVEVSWQVHGGRGPYELNIGSTGVVGASGTVELLCGRDDLDLSRLPEPGIDILGPRTKVLTVEAKDSDGARVTQTLAIEIIQDAGEFHDGLEASIELVSGHTHAIGDMYFEIPEGDTMTYDGDADVSDDPLSFLTWQLFLKAEDAGHVTEGWIADDFRSHWGPVRIVDREQEPASPEEQQWWEHFFASVRSTPFIAGDSRGSQTNPLAPDSTGGAAAQGSGAAGAQSASTTCGKVGSHPTTGVRVTATETDRWLPYGTVLNDIRATNGLACDTRVSVHPNVLEGRPITVCTANTVSDSNAEHNEGVFIAALQQAVDDWNEMLGPDRDNAAVTLKRGLDHSAFEFDEMNHDCPSDVANDASNTDFVRIFDERCGTDADCLSGSAGVARTGPEVDPPRITRNRIRIYRPHRKGVDVMEGLLRVFRHELGHMLGLGDYKSGCWRVVDASGVVESSVMSYGSRGGSDPSGCFSAEITGRDLADLHAIYHPRSVENLEVVGDVSGSGGAVLRWEQSPVTPAVYNSRWLGVFLRDGFSRDPLTGAPSGRAGWRLVGRVEPDEVEFSFADAGELVARDVAVAGLTRGDHRVGRYVVRGLGPEHARLAPIEADAPDARVWSVGEVDEVVSDPQGFFGVHPLALGVLESVAFGGVGEGQWEFRVFTRAASPGGVAVRAGDLVITQTPAQSQKGSPFDDDAFVPVRVIYGSRSISLFSCPRSFVHRGRYVCHVSALLPTNSDGMPLRVIVESASAGGDVPVMQGTYELRREDVIKINGTYEYGLPGLGNWRFMFISFNDLVPLLGTVPLDPDKLIGGGVLLAMYPGVSLGFDYELLNERGRSGVRYLFGSRDHEREGGLCSEEFFLGDRFDCWTRFAATWQAVETPTELTIRPLAAPAAEGASAPGIGERSWTPVIACDLAGAPQCAPAATTAP